MDKGFWKAFKSLPRRGFLYSLCPGQGVGAFPEIVMKIFITLTESTGYSQFDLLPDSVNKAVWNLWNGTIPGTKKSKIIKK